MYDAVLVLSFGGPDRHEDVMPFLENVTRGKPIPRERLEEVAEHYHHFGGQSPINQQNRDLVEALRAELQASGPALPVYWGNRNWHPLLPDTLRQMSQDGVRRALGFFTSAYSSYSGCRQYRENIAEAQAQVEGAPTVDKLRVFYNHPGFVEPMADGLRQALGKLPQAQVFFTAHSIPLTMASTSQYEAQLREACRLVAETAGLESYELVYQSRSGPPQQPWLEPDVCERIREAAGRGVKALVLVPIGFTSDHMEVLYDLDTEARDLCSGLGVAMERVPTVGIEPRFIAMIRELIQERCGLITTRRALGSMGPSHDICPPDCCAYTPGRPTR